MERSSGVLLPVFSLPSPYGIGTMGDAAYAFIDFLKEARQSYWQILPVGPTDYGYSPYQSPSAFAGNPDLIDLDILVRSGLLEEKEVKACAKGMDPKRIDYATLRPRKEELLRKAFARGWEKDRAGVDVFSTENAAWLHDYALFMALKKEFEGASWLEWPDEGCRMHREESLWGYREKLREEIEYQTYVQYLFFQQWGELRTYAHKQGIRIIGDLPLYVSLDSADVWSAPENFLLDEKNIPLDVAGVPPDYFSEEGQLWGNPLYNYEHMEQSGYGWWIRRIGGAEKLYDVLRIDHFRGLESFWAVPYGEKTAKNGRWIKGPGMKLIGVLKNWFTNMEFIAEDLGMASSEVAKLLEESGFPGMRVLEFAFSPDEESSYLPHAHVRNAVCYPGTHDNDTVLGWKENAEKGVVEKAGRYLGLNKNEGFVRGILRGAMSSVADLCIIQMQDWLELGSEARINVPGTVGGNWEWRMLPGAATRELAEEMAAMTELYGRVH